MPLSKPPKIMAEIDAAYKHSLAVDAAAELRHDQEALALMAAPDPRAYEHLSGQELAEAVASDVLRASAARLAGWVYKGAMTPERYATIMGAHVAMLKARVERQARQIAELNGESSPDFKAALEPHGATLDDQWLAMNGVIVGGTHD